MSRAKVGAFTLIKNEAKWVGYCVMAAKDLVDEWVYFDGNSTDGTVEILEYLRDHKGVNIKLHKGQDPRDLKDDYVRAFNECLKQVSALYAWFLHPDMILTAGPGPLFSPGPLAFSVSLRSFGGEPGGAPLEFVEGRTDRWKSIMRNSLGLHYHGHYGAAEEDMYFSKVTGGAHQSFKDFKKYPFSVVDSGISLNHYSDVRPYERRLGRMKSCLLNQGYEPGQVAEIAKGHPRVTLESGGAFGRFALRPAGPAPEVFARHAEEFAKVLGVGRSDVLPFEVEEAKCSR